MANTSLDVHVLMRFSKKTGKVDTCMTSLGYALLQMWALQNTPKTKSCLVFNRNTGMCVFATYGTEDGFPKIRKEGKDEMESCEEFGITLEELQSIQDDRFDLQT